MAPVVALAPLRDLVVGLAVPVAVLAMFLVVQRSIIFLLQARTIRREPGLSRLVYEAVQASPVVPGVLADLGWLDRRLVRSILLGLALDLRGESAEAISQLYDQLGFLKHDLARLGSWRAAARAAAAADIGLVGRPKATPALLRAVNDRDARVRQAAVWALGQTGTPDDLRQLVRLLGDRNLSVAHRAQEVLAERGREVVNEIVKYAEKTSSRAGRRAAIELIGWLRIPAVDLLLGFINDLDAEIRVKSVKAAAAIGDPRCLPIFQSRLEDVSWPVRCQAAKGLSLFGSPESIPQLSKALRDAHWWVRFYAASALAEVGPAGEQALSQALQDPEQKVREMARYLLERGDLVPALP